MIIETERLILRNYQKSDWERVHLYSSLPKFSQYDTWGPNTVEDTQNYIGEVIKKSSKNPRYEFELAVVLKDSSLLIGGCGIRRDWESSSFANLGYCINPSFQGKGYATEITKALIDFGFNNLKLLVIYATCDTRNIASYSVMEKVRMRKVGHVKNHKKVRGHMRDSYCYEITINDIGH